MNLKVSLSATLFKTQVKTEGKGKNLSSQGNVTLIVYEKL